MTTTARPTPSDIAHQPAHRPPALPAAEAIAPGHLQGGERMLTAVHRGLRISRMNPETRLVALTLLGYSHHKTGTIYPRFQPTPEELAEATGLTTGQIAVQIQVLTQRGWLRSRYVTQGPDAGRTGLALAIPALVLEQVRAARAAQTNGHA